MAEERASLTVTLTDEISPGLRQITAEFETLRTKIREATRESAQGFAEIREKIGGTTVTTSGLVTQASRWGRAFETVFRDTAGALQAVGVAGGEVTRSLNTAMQAATGFGTAMATAGKSVGAFGAIASGVTVGAVALTAALVKTNQELTNLKLRLMESDEAQIRRSQMALRSIGAGAEEAEGIMTRMSQFVFDSYRGVQSEMFGALEKFGPNATRIVDRARQMFHEEGRDMVEVQQYVVREISKFSPTVQRFIWQSLQIGPEIAMQWRDAQAKLPAVYQRSAEQAKVLSEQQERL